jgi:hypothetical protein
MKLFDNATRIDESPAKFSESSYDFLNRSSWPDCEKIRDLMEAWFSVYSASDKQQLKNTFMSATYSEHLGAWWELYVFTLYRRLGYDVEVHPEIPDTSIEKRPDFLVYDDKTAFYVECTAVSPRSHSGEQDWSGDPWIYDSINEVNDPNFFVGLRIVKAGTQRPRVRDITGPLKEWLSALNPDDDSAADIPPLLLEVKDWVLSFTAYPIDPSKRTGTGRLLGILPPSGAFFINDVDVLHRALRDKGGRYGERLDKPFIVALASVTGFTEEEDVTDAVFGRKAVEYDRGERARLVRLRNGYWRPVNGDKPARGARVSGVLFGQQLAYRTVATAFPKLWVNPWAHLPLTSTEPFTLISAQDVEVSESPGTGSAALFGLPASWPN